MDTTLIWLLVSSALLIIYYIKVSARYRLLSYDLEEYLLAGKRLSPRRFVLATTTISFLGLIALPHMGLFYRSGFSYGFTALAAIIVPLVSALFARRLWILGRIYNPLTPARLLGDYYGSHAIRTLTTITAVLVALSLTVMSLLFAASLMGGLLGVSPSAGAVNEAAHWVTPVLFCIITALLFYHTAFGGMGAIMRIAAPAGVALVITLLLAALIAIDAIGGFGAFFEQLVRLRNSPVTAPLFDQGDFLNLMPAAAPANMAWPGMMVASSLIALAGLATAPAALMTGFTPQKGENHAPAQFFAAALLGGFLLLTTTIMIALAARLGPHMTDLAAKGHDSSISVPGAGEEPEMIVQLLLTSPLGSLPLASLFSFSLLAAMIAGTAAALMAAGSMIANDILFERMKQTRRLTWRRSITREAIGGLVIIALAIAWQKPDDPLPLILLAGAFGLQLLPALVGLCYFKGLGGASIRNGLMAGLLAVIATSSLTQGAAAMAGLSLPYGAWPVSLHPAFWGLGVNLGVMVLSGLIAFLLAPLFNHAKTRKKQLEHRLSYHVLPDGQSPMSKHAGTWRGLAWLIGTLFIGVTAAPFTGFPLPELLTSSLPSLWIWQLFSWIVGLALVYVIAYKLQPVFDPEQALEGSLNPQRRRFRVKARSRRTSDHSTSDENQNETD